MEFKDLIFVSGKGGTGKSTVATLLARQLSQSGRRVLLVELEQMSSVKALTFRPDSPTYQPSPSGFGFDWCLLTGLDCLVEYVSTFTKLESLTKRFFDSALLRTLVNVAPGLNDLSILGKLTSQFRQHGPGFDYDHVIVDAPSTGSFQSLIQAPRTLGKSVSRGPLHSQSLAIDEVLKNKNHVQYVFVSLFEELPVDELEETLNQFIPEYAEQLHVVMNKSLNLQEVEKQEGDWADFIDKKRANELVQKQRVKEMWKHCFQVDLFTEAFPEKLAQSKGEVLRPL